MFDLSSLTLYNSFFVLTELTMSIITSDVMFVELLPILIISKWAKEIFSNLHRFDELLKKAVLLNTRGTKLMLDLAKEMKNLVLFAHISTAYCHLGEKVKSR